MREAIRKTSLIRDFIMSQAQKPTKSENITESNTSEKMVLKSALTFK